METLPKLDRDAVVDVLSDLFDVPRSRIVRVTITGRLDHPDGALPKATILQDGPVDLRAAHDAILDATGLRGCGVMDLEINADGATVTYDDDRVEVIPWDDDAA